MSLINQMLQDLDKRGSDATVSNVAQAGIRAVPAQGNALRLVWRAALLLIAVSAAVLALWAWRQPIPAMAATKTVMATPPSQQIAPAAADTMRMSLSLDPDYLMLPPMRTVSPTAESMPAIPALFVAQEYETKPAPAPFPAATIPDKPPAATVQNKEAVLVAKVAQPALQENLKPSSIVATNEARNDVNNTFKLSKEVTPQQTTENAYRQAIARIDAGQSAEAIGTLEHVLQRNAKHTAARQTLVGLLLENKRQDDAVRILQEGLVIDPAQPGLAMILARLQVERGNQRPALETLQRSLPYAVNRADYQAFLAALLEREKRHQEATAHYAIALRQFPQNGLWWMGYGISLQADNRPAEAQDAFTRAKASNMLSAELHAFVDQRLRQIQP